MNRTALHVHPDLIGAFHCLHFAAPLVLPRILSGSTPHHSAETVTILIGPGTNCVFPPSLSFLPILVHMKLHLAAVLDFHSIHFRHGFRLRPLGTVFIAGRDQCGHALVCQLIRSPINPQIDDALMRKGQCCILILGSLRKCSLRQFSLVVLRRRR